MTQLTLDQKINAHFPGLVVRKDLTKMVKGNAIVPSYVLEYLLGQYCATNDETSIQSGIESVKDVLRKHYVHRNESGLVRSTIKERGRHKVIDKISVDLNDRNDCYEATFSNLGIKKVLVDSDTIKKHPKLLVSGVWCIADLEYLHSEEKDGVPWILSSIKPIQMSHFELDGYLQARKAFTTEEWIDVLIQSMGFDPSQFGKRNKLLQLVRMIPFCERNYNLIELGPKGTGKSHIYSEFSPHGTLISGGEVTSAKLFVNNASGKIGLVGYWDTVAFDEFAGKDKRVDKALVDIMKNYMANKSFSRGVETLGAEASMVFVGNTQRTVPYMLKHSDLFEDLPEKFHDSAFLDRIHFYIPGWEVDIIRGEMFSNGYGFVVDYLAEILRNFRGMDFSLLYSQYFQLHKSLSTRDRDGVHKTFSGLMKILFPNQDATPSEVEEILRFAIEGRRRVKDQLMRIDPTFEPVRFVYSSAGQGDRSVKTLEQELYPQYFQEEEPSAPAQEPASPAVPVAATTGPELKEQHRVLAENARGISYESLFGAYLENCHKITLTDPYLRLFYQQRNLMEFLECVAKHKPDEEEVVVEVLTIADEFKQEQQVANFEKMVGSCATVGIELKWAFDGTGHIHARHIVTDTGWKIILDRGLDIFQPYEMNDAFSMANRLQSKRACKQFEVSWVRIQG
jgi:ATP-dependent Lon protease